MAGLKSHWETIYSARPPEEVSWYQPHLKQSLAMILQTGVGPESRIIDVGGGASTLVDDLLAKGFREVTVLDISEAALNAAKRRLGPRASQVNWVTGDIAEIELPGGAYDLWNDRAVFHFLIDPADRRAYVKTLNRSLKRGGHLILASFSLTGPERCSGLEVVRYSPGTLSAELGEGYRLIETSEEKHRTPSGKVQDFVYCRFQRQA
jgi:ubiquinone/menaquinone biosynthesis C-methylase UbiE